MTRAVAINVGANTNTPGFRGPIYPNGAVEFVPIPESEPTKAPVPTYGDLSLSLDLPERVRDTPVHLDPEFAGGEAGERYTYGDPYGVKARPLLDLAAGDRVYFYATLVPRGDEPHPRWVTPDWGAYIIGRFALAEDPLPGDQYAHLPADRKASFATNAHVKRETFDAAVLLSGDPDRSGLLPQAVPLSSADGGADPNRIVTELSSDSGRGPWWRWPLRFGADATAELRELEGASHSRLAALGGQAQDR